MRWALAEYRDALDEVTESDTARSAMRITVECLIRPDDLLELFGSDPDLAGGFTNVSQFVRDSDRNADVQVFWREFSSKDARQPDEGPPHRDELCAVPFFELRRFLGNKAGAWEWSGETSRWEPRNPRDIWPGMTLLLPLLSGGYSDELGWTGESSDKPTLHAFGREENLGVGDEPNSQSNLWYPLADHLADVEVEVSEITEAFPHLDSGARALQIAARWHDCGKALPRWQGAVYAFAERVRARIQELLSDPAVACRSTSYSPSGCRNGTCRRTPMTQLWFGPSSRVCARSGRTVRWRSRT